MIAYQVFDEIRCLKQVQSVENFQSKSLLLISSMDILQKFKTTYEADKKLWRGYVSGDLLNGYSSLGEKIYDNLKGNPKRPVLVYHDEAITLNADEFLSAVARVAQNLRKLGIKSDDVIGVVCLNSDKVVILLNACIVIGAIPNTLEVSFTSDDIGHMFDQTKPKLVICDQEVIGKVETALSKIKSDAEIFTVGSSNPSSVKCFSELLKPTGIEHEFVPTKFQVPADKKMLAILCSSGTTGLCKGVSVSHAFPFLHSATLTQLKENSIKTFERSLTFSTAYWASGFYACVTSAVSQINTMITTKQRFDVNILIELIEKYGVNRFVCPPSQLSEIIRSEALAKANLSTLNSIIVGGSAVSQYLREKFRTKFPNIRLSVVYGMSEYTIGFPLGDDNGVSVGGMLMDNVEVKIVDDDGNRLGVGHQGELRVRNSRYNFLGYYGNPEATQSAIDNEGFFITGDIGYFDEHNHLYIIDRKKEILKYKNFQYNPSEIEEVIEMMEEVEHVAVVGVPDPDVTDLPTAVVVLKIEFKNKISEKFIQEFVASKLPVNKHLQ